MSCSCMVIVLCMLFVLFSDATITKDVRQYLTTRFTKNSVDSELQHQIRENLHLRVVPCTLIVDSCLFVQ